MRPGTVRASAPTLRGTAMSTSTSGFRAARGANVSRLRTAPRVSAADTIASTWSRFAATSASAIARAPAVAATASARARSRFAMTMLWKRQLSARTASFPISPAPTTRTFERAGLPDAAREVDLDAVARRQHDAIGSRVRGRQELEQALACVDRRETLMKNERGDGQLDH